MSSASGGVDTCLSAVQNVVAADGRAMVDFEKEWWRVMDTNQQFHDAVITYRDEQVGNVARGTSTRGHSGGV